MYSTLQLIAFAYSVSDTNTVICFIFVIKFFVRPKNIHMKTVYTVVGLIKTKILLIEHFLIECFANNTVDYTYMYM